MLQQKCRLLLLRNPSLRKYLLPLKILRDLHTNRLLSQNDGRVVLDGKATIVTMMLHLTVLLTFGVCYPMLGFAVAFTIFAETVTHKLTMGKFLFITKVFRHRHDKAVLNNERKDKMMDDDLNAAKPNAVIIPLDNDRSPVDVGNPVLNYNNEFNSLDEAKTYTPSEEKEICMDFIIDDDEKIIIDDYKFDHRLTAGGNDFAMLVLEESNRDSWSGIHACIWYFIMMVSAFWALIFFDMAADQNENIILGVEVILIYAIIVPILIFIIGRARYHPRALRFYQRCKIFLSTWSQSKRGLVRPPSRATEMSAQSRVVDNLNDKPLSGESTSDKRRSLPRDLAILIQQNFPFGQSLLRESVENGQTTSDEVVSTKGGDPISVEL